MRGLQAKLFDSPSEAASSGGEPAPAEEAGDSLRSYQEEAVTAALARIQSGSSRSIVKLFTGAGKTRTGIALVRRWLNGGDHALWLANRTFLVEDALERLRPALGGAFISREQAGYHGSYTRMTVGSAATFAGKRLERMDPDRYGLIIADECQYLDSPGGQKIANFFRRAHILGLSATPGPAQVFGGRKAATVYEKDVLWGIKNGYFVPILPRYENVVGLDLSDVDSADGDFKIGELDKAVAKVATPIAKLAYRFCEDRPTLIYCPGVATVHAVNAWLNDQRSGCSVATDAKTPPAVRRQTLIDFKAGRIQYIVNCGIYLYGLDVPTCRAIVIARPTEDRDLWEQMVGRGGRPEAGIGELWTAEQRVQAIAASSKPNMLLLVLSGDAGKHSLCDVADLDETADRQVRDKASKDIRENPTKPLADALRDARAWAKGENERVRLAMQQALVQSEGGAFDPFSVNERKSLSGPFAPAWTKEPATTAQRYWQRTHGLPWDISKGQAAQFRGKFEKWMKAQGQGHPPNIPGWLKQEWIAEILRAERTPGEDG